MRTRILILISLFLTFTRCQTPYYTMKDYQSVLKIDSHVHINSEKGFFEDQAAKDNFALLTINVDHSDSTAVRKQLDWALNSVKKYPGRVFYSATFYFDTAGWRTRNGARRLFLISMRISLEVLFLLSFGKTSA